FDGFDELELRVGFTHAADYLNTLLRAVTDQAKVVLTSRTQHFRSTTQIRTALGEQVATLTAEVCTALSQLAERGYTADQAAHTVGSGTLLVRTPEGSSRSSTSP
ncbi:MAG: hypothetical protein ACRDTC_16075, partial [Pseudonocardiaceae bacterium]